ncbi:prenyltransferase [Thermococcus sp. 21S9]|uniref:prenyltransferase n=1 Tax=Thermococcus sp. 21S9 TaxID=1638223 RepID=UPI0014397817|nr:prenyltransferase [Thermococcus sp. 21S9]NJE53964.1 prenyltransferase [Thermococcus sp. 21S9]
MLVVEVLESAGEIPDPYVKAVTYARIGEELARKGHPLYKRAFLSAFESLTSIEDPFKMLKALLSIGVSLGRARIKAYRKVFARVFSESRDLSPPQRDELLKTASLALLSLGDVGEAITFALDISNDKLRQSTLVSLVRGISRSLEVNPIKTAYRLRKIRLALEYITDEPYRSKALLELSKALVALGSYEGAFSAIREMGSREWARQAFKELAFRLSELGVIERYVDSFTALTEELSEKFGENFIAELSTALALAGRGELAVHLLRKLGDESLFERVALDLLDKNPSAIGDFLSALNEGESSRVGKVLMNRILEEPTPEKREIVNTIARFARSEEVWAKVARFYILTGDVESARRIGLALQSPRLRSVVMADVAHHYLKRGDVERAIDTALEVRDRRFASLLMSEILIKALHEELKGLENGKAQVAGGKAGKPA